MDAIYPSAELNYVVPSRAHDVAQLRGGVVVSLGGIGSQPQDGTGGSRQEVQVVPDACRTCSVVLCCIFALPREEKSSKKVGEVKGWNNLPWDGQLLVYNTWASRAVICYKTLT
jgi:hypothetical protein